MGRGLHSVTIISEKILNDLMNKLLESDKILTKRAAILNTERKQSTHLANIKNYLKRKYKLEEGFDNKQLDEAQIQYLYSEINNKILHKILYKCKENPLVDIEYSSNWLTKGNIKARDEAVFCMTQDKNMFYGEQTKCVDCKTSPRTVEHLATRCNRMLYHDHTRRHNEVLRCIHLLFIMKVRYL